MLEKLVRILCVPLALYVATSAQAGDAARGESKAIVCSACHGPEGNSLNPEWPSLAGQNEAYIVAALKAFKEGKRENVLMSSQAIGLTDQEMADLGAYYASKKMAPKEADPAIVAIGERIYRGGIKEKEVAACIACHGPTGHGNAPAGYPAVGGQYATYTATQLAAYGDGARDSDPHGVMRSIAGSLTENETRAVASYIQGLRDE